MSITNQLDENFTIAITWRVGDVQSIRQDLSVAQCINVLERAKYSHDACYGICWDTLSSIAENLFPETI